MLLDGYRSPDGRSISVSNLRIPPKDDDADSIGFVDIAELKKLNAMYRRRTVAEVTPPLPSRAPPQGLNAVKAWLKRRRELSTRKKYCYTNPLTEDDCSHLHRKLSVMSAVQLPLPPPKRKKASISRRLQGWLVCFQH